MKCVAIVIPARFVAGRFATQPGLRRTFIDEDLQGPASCAIPPLWAMPGIRET